ncbi:unnamed protein product [Strongylus vulgaris]|uniref:phenylalanine--tRNA ligase n=1 Tax=Strongylus vulgaris TaxID=40348 RepID=A0A3P7LGW9_STRVU|nr:unnamed protein product [Strongylus vulgaris]
MLIVRISRLYLGRTFSASAPCSSSAIPQKNTVPCPQILHKGERPEVYQCEYPDFIWEEHSLPRLHVLLRRFLKRTQFHVHRSFTRVNGPRFIREGCLLSFPFFVINTSLCFSLHSQIDGKSIPTDTTWNLSPAVHSLLNRRLLQDQYNPLSLLKQRIVDYMHQTYRKGGGDNRCPIFVIITTNVFSASRSPLFTVCENEPRIVTTFENFDSLLTPLDHVSRRPSDTYYINKTHCLRAHTSAHQYQLMKEGLDAFLVVGDVYRRDEVDRTHYPCFHQLEGVRLFSPTQLFNTSYENKVPIFEKGERTPEKQERHTLDASKALEIQLKTTLEGLSDALFGSSCEKRWVEAYFPFTHPSFELEVFYEDKWMEVLGCGIMEQKLLESAGVRDQAGWAFGLGLERLAMILYGIPDIRLFWSTDSGFLSQFYDKSPTEEIKYKPISVHPQASLYTLLSVVSEIPRVLKGSVKLTDEFLNKKKNRRSQTYRIVYRSHSKALTKDEVNVIHKRITDQLVEQYGVTMR